MVNLKYFYCYNLLSTCVKLIYNSGRNIDTIQLLLELIHICPTCWAWKKMFVVHLRNSSFSCPQGRDVTWYLCVGNTSKGSYTFPKCVSNNSFLWFKIHLLASTNNPPFWYCLFHLWAYSRIGKHIVLKIRWLFFFYSHNSMWQTLRYSDWARISWLDVNLNLFSAEF